MPRKDVNEFLCNKSDSNCWFAMKMTLEYMLQKKYFHLSVRILINHNRYPSMQKKKLKRACTTKLIGLSVII